MLSATNILFALKPQGLFRSKAAGPHTFFICVCFQRYSRDLFEGFLDKKYAKPTAGYSCFLTLKPTRPGEFVLKADIGIWRFFKTHAARVRQQGERNSPIRFSESPL